MNCYKFNKKRRLFYYISSKKLFQNFKDDIASALYQIKRGKSASIQNRAKNQNN